MADSTFCVCSFCQLFSRCSALPFLDLTVFVLDYCCFSNVGLLERCATVTVLLFSLRCIVSESFKGFVVVMLLTAAMRRATVYFSLVCFICPVGVSGGCLLVAIVNSITVCVFFNGFLFDHTLTLLGLSGFRGCVVGNRGKKLAFFFFVLAFILTNDLLAIRREGGPGVGLFCRVVVLTLIVRSFSLAMTRFTHIARCFFLDFSICLPYIVSAGGRPIAELFFVYYSTVLVVVCFVLVSRGSVGNIVPCGFVRV